MKYMLSITLLLLFGTPETTFCRSIPDDKDGFTYNLKEDDPSTESRISILNFQGGGLYKFIGWVTDQFYTRHTVESRLGFINTVVLLSKDGSIKEVRFPKSKNKEIEDLLLDIIESSAGDWSPGLEAAYSISIEVDPFFNRTKKLTFSDLLCITAWQAINMSVKSEEFIDMIENGDFYPGRASLYNMMEIWSEQEPYLITEQAPTFLGGDWKYFSGWVQENLKWPARAGDIDVQGSIVLSFIIERDGSVSNIEIVRGIHPWFDEEAVKVVASSPRWKPGKQSGIPVRVKYHIPVKFHIYSKTNLL